MGTSMVAYNPVDGAKDNVATFTPVFLANDFFKRRENDATGIAEDGYRNNPAHNRHGYCRMTVAQKLKDNLRPFHESFCFF
nr:hypothetical protein [Paenibacillus lutrae]